MKLVSLILSLAVAAVTSPVSAAAPGTTEFLLQQCEAKTTAACPTFVRGFIEGLRTSGSWQTSGICIPDGVTTVQSMAVFVRWANMHPEKWNQHDGLSLRDSLREAFPCQTSPPAS